MDVDAFRRGMWAEGFVAALATLAVAWPLTTLLRERSWLLPAVLLVALVAVTGAVLRTLDVPPSLVSLGQLFVGLGGLTGTYLRDTLWRGLVPTADTLDRVGELLRQAGTVLQTYAAPAPTTAGVAFLVVAVLTLTAVSVDSMGVTGRAPASAGIPLAAGFLVSVSNSGEAMEPWFFAAIAGLWLVMLAQQGHRVVGAWPSEQRRESLGADDVSSGTPHHRGLAQLLGALALIAAVVGASVVPHLPPTYFSDGLARNPDARSGGSGGAEVSFTETMDPSQDLRSQSQAPVLNYRTNAPRLEPLRVTAAEEFSNGKWRAEDRPTSGLLPLNAELPGPDGLSEDVQTVTQQLRVTGNQLPPPHLAAPSPLTSVRLGDGAAYRFDPRDDTVVVQGATSSYEVEYLAIEGGAQLPADVGERPADPEDFDAELLEIDEASADAIAELADEVVGEETNALQVAILIQDHFRRAPYRYSLDLAPSAEADSGDPIGGFLATRQGYCVQFATAMVMMARTEGIPARMAVGFLPGQIQVDGSRKVVAADAHTWPELWIDGMGWTRFEPTPGIRANQPPAYAQDREDETATETTTTVTRTETVAPEPTSAAPAAPSLLDQLREMLPLLGRVLLGLLVLALLLAVVPVVGRRHREAGLRSATTTPEQVEGRWTYLVRTLQDLGVPAPPARSPRGMGRHYREETVLDRRGEQALGRVTETLERTRYAPATAVREQDVDRMDEDVREIVDQVRHATPWNVRANAAVLPRSGFDGLRAWGGHARRG
ncbi:transglutaminase [Ornithinimicrobium tianjinense]|uniref:Transglutaminase n=2 Tax=Ornithinimicrobium tianjinense TaxID=1195761 RepID=A0A917BGR6_9MICO|nr:transglutaminase [Ornithinimicrobium tianjinense]